ncbi:hypothetical protein GEAM_0706 [Ewingella americana ATCC 33852]|jgi:hypothetical protein|uniref:Uncharacterized protein n=2 Tax=Ewingella americana TaxID=41202 RepID=A0A085GL59_EWIA3|nr:hypothetical protein GEAM_0706 [Ewingella americana ATCC 33852]
MMPSGVIMFSTPKTLSEILVTSLCVLIVAAFLQAYFVA